MFIEREGERERERRRDGGKEGGSWRKAPHYGSSISRLVHRQLERERERERERELITFPCLEGGMECGTADTESPRLADCRLDWNGDRQNTLNILKPTIGEITVTSRV